MLLWLITTKNLDDIPKGEALAYVVSGITEDDARRYLYFNVKYGQTWLNPDTSHCVEIGLANSPEQKIYIGNFQQ